MSPQAQTVAMPPRFPLVQQLYTRSPNTPITQDARLVNAYAEKDPQDKDYWIFKRVGIGATPYLSTPQGFPGGTYYSQNFQSTISIANGQVYTNEVRVGAVLPGIQNWFETVNSNPQTIVIMNPYEAFIYTPATQSLVTISDPNYPVYSTITVPGWAYLDGTLYVMDLSGAIWGTAGLNNAAVWDALNVIQASSKADQGVFLATQLSYVVAFKQWTTQIFYDAENPTGSPLGPVPDAQIPFGCLHANTVQKIDEILIWVTSNQTISPQVILMENLSPKIVSTPSVDRLLDNIIVSVAGQVPPGPPPRPPPSIDNAVFSFAFKHAGHRFYGLTLTVLNITLVYDIDQRLWYLWTDSNGNYWPYTNFTYTSPTEANEGLHLAQLLPSYAGTSGVVGNIYPMDGDYAYPSDLGQLFPVDIYTPNFDGGTDRRKSLNMLYFVADQTPGSVLQARYSDNDYRSWSNFRSISLNDERPYLDQEGTFVRRAYHLRHRCNTPFRIKSSGMQIDIGTL